jgi:hypothetical protein
MRYVTLVWKRYTTTVTQLSNLQPIRDVPALLVFLSVSKKVESLKLHFTHIKSDKLIMIIYKIIFKEGITPSMGFLCNCFPK